MLKYVKKFAPSDAKALRPNSKCCICFVCTLYFIYISITINGKRDLIFINVFQQGDWICH